MPKLCLLLLLMLIPASAASQTPDPASQPLRLQPGDLLQIEIWREEDLSGTFLIEPSGSVILPLLGKQEAAGIPLIELRDRLLGLYRTELRNPSINITPLRRIYVLGEVNAPGLYTVDPTVSLAGAVALAGGASPTGDLRNIRLVRDGEVIREEIPSAIALSNIGVRSGDEIFVDRRGWLDRNSTFLVSAILSVTSIITSIIIAQGGL